MTRIHRHRFDNGLELLIEPIEHATSCAMSWLVPAGVAHEPPGEQGVAAVLAEMLHRGAGDRGAREHSDALDELGVRRSVDPMTLYTGLSATFLGRRLGDVLPLLSDMVLRPALEQTAFEPARQLALQEIDSLDDDPQQRAMVELKQAHLGEPTGRPTMGRAEDVAKLDVDRCRSFWKNRFVPDGSILALAGNVEIDSAQKTVGRLIEAWSGKQHDTKTDSSGSVARRHLPSPSTQLHIGLAHEAAGQQDPASLQEQLAVAVLSGGMSGRLFTEVREARGLCYSVYATYWAMRQRGAVFAYAGTTAARAAETLAVMTDQLQRMAEGVEADEFERARTGLLARVVMQGESTSARAAAIASETALRGAPRTLDEWSHLIESARLEQLNRYLAERGTVSLTQLTIGPEPVDAVEKPA
ncbi:MAG: pitrilysin family protein [Phycisphaeraceae bacterium]|nr:pitrilysin family protein [Phycisphaeraceae bacterium]